MTNHITDIVEYSVCEDCLLEIANCEGDYDITEHVERELDGKNGHFSVGVEQTEDDSEGTGYDEFSWGQCELCRTNLGGPRHGVSMIILK